MPSTNGHGPKRAILYARVSTDEQARSGYSLAQQVEALREYAALEGYEVLEEVVDPAQSGASLERPGMDRVRDLVAAGGVYVVLAQDRDRIAREPAYHYLLRREFEEHGTKVRALNDRGDGSPEGELTDGILDQLAKFERAKIAERTRRGKLRKAREGKMLRTSRPDYGFKYDETGDAYVVAEEEMRIVRRIFLHVSAGETLNSIKRKLELEGVSPPMNGHRGGVYWTPSFLRNLILDDVYGRTFSPRSRRWSPLRWLRDWTSPRATVSSGSTVRAPRARRCRSLVQTDANTRRDITCARTRASNG
jgi:site-specific DNA recombinase